MATNVYFSQKNRMEQNLYEDIVIESLQMYGQDVYYLPREIITQDTILNEAVESEFNEAYVIEMYIENTSGFEGDGELMSKFGLEIRDQATFIVSRRRFRQLVSFNNNQVEQDRPLEGDLIYYPASKSLFEIKFVEHEQPFYQLTNLPVYKMQCELFEVSGEKFDTDISALDSQLRQIQTGIMLRILHSTVKFQPDDLVQQELLEANSGKFIFGKVISVNDTLGGYDIEIGEIYSNTGQFEKFSESDEGWKNLKCDSTGADAPIIEAYDIDTAGSDGTFIGDNQAQNRDFELEADNIIDFTESNPFGDPSEV
jgi:hypothetical protein